MAKTELCEKCQRKPATWTAYREIGFGVTATLARLCTRCMNKMKGAN